MWTLGIILSATLAALAWQIARARPLHRAVAVLVTFGVVADVVRRGLALLVLEPARAALHGAPFTGAPRAVFHLDEALFVACSVGLAALAVIVFLERPARAVATLIGLYGTTVAALVLGYPVVRGPVLVRVYSAVQIVAFAVAVAAFASWWRRGERPDLTIGSVMVLVGLDFGALVAWRLGWDAAAVMYLIAHGALVVLHVGELWDGSRSLA